jgi:homoserine kinase
MRVRVPASTANLGPGFDTLGLALNLYTEVSVEPADSLELICQGEGSQFETGPDHLAARVAREVLGHDRVRIEVSSEVPVSRGLGSSAALAVAVAAACGADDPLTLVALLEGHADNAAACVLGGFVTAAIVDGVVHARPLPLDPDLSYVAVVPARELETKTARGAIPASIPHADAVFNLGRMGLLIAGMADQEFLRPFAAQDRIHQHYRTELFPESVEILRVLTEAGALASFWSGAGPTLLGVCPSAIVHWVRDAGAEAMSNVGLVGEAFVLDADLQGITYLSPDRTRTKQ